MNRSDTYALLRFTDSPVRLRISVGIRYWTGQALVVWGRAVHAGLSVATTEKRFAGQPNQYSLSAAMLAIPCGGAWRWVRGLTWTVLAATQCLARAALLLVLGTACSREEPKKAPTHRYLVGLAMHLTFDDYAKSLMQAFESELQRADVLYEIADADADGTRQAEQIRTFTAKRVDALVVVPIDDAKIVDAVNEASAAAIPVISVTDIPNAHVAATIPGNDRRNGAAAAKLLVQKTGGKGEVLVFGKSGHTRRIDERLAGFNEVIAPSSLKVVEYYNFHSRALLIDGAIRALEEHPAVKGIFGVAGFHAQCIATALRRVGRRDVALTAVDGNTEVLQLIRAGYVTGVAVQYPWMHGEYAAKLSLDLIRRKPARSVPDTRTLVITEQNVDLGLTVLGSQYASIALERPNEEH